MNPAASASTSQEDPPPYIHWTRADGVRWARHGGYLLLAYPDGRWSMTGPEGGKVACASTQGEGEAAAVAALTAAMKAPAPAR